MAVTLTQGFSKSSGSDSAKESFAANDELHDAVSDNRIDTAQERDQYFNAVLSNPDLREYDIDVLSMKQGTVNNEQTANALMREASVSGDNLGNNFTLERSTDQVFEGYYSQDRQKSLNLSVDGEVHDVLAFTPPELWLPEPTFPLVLSEPDQMQACIAAVILELEMAGVPESDLSKALASGGADNNAATIDALAELAQKNNVPSVQDYLSTMAVAQSFMDGIGQAALSVATSDPVASPAYDDAQPIRKSAPVFGMAV